MNKKELRQFIRMQKRMYTQEQLDDQSKVIIGKLLVHPKVKQAKTVMMYYSLNDEVNTHEAIDRLVAQGKRVVLPAVTGDTTMELRCYEGPKDLMGGFFNIMEPVGKTFTDFDATDVAIIPGMGFDTRGHRLGRGKGYYDRFLARIPALYKIGVCFPFQKMPGIPADDNDIMMDEVIS
jgi:5-formyltetrahydrofolate cyclo-ligase